MLYENNFYRTSDRLLDIEFLFVDLGGSTGWRAYILTDINYKACSILRSDDCTIVHRLTESRSDMKRRIANFMQMTGRTLNTSKSIYYICWSKAIHNLDNMREVAKTWSEITAYYITHGGTFPSIQQKLKAQGIIEL